VKFATARLEEIPGAGAWIPVRRHFGIAAFGINAFRAPAAGEELIGEHEEDSGQEELYVVLDGHATFTVAGEEIDAPPGTAVFVQPGVRRKAVARDFGTTILAIGGKAGEPYAPLPWEENVEILPLFERGEYAAAKAKLLEALDRHPGAGGLLYNLACAEARLGELDKARAHLDEALAAEPRLAETAKTDPDLEAIP
jgi:mannose-6-phosphate isomerase-like protein (cupin superfamily)